MPSTGASKPSILAIISVLAVFGLAAPALAQDEAGDWGAFGVQTKWMDTAVDPGDDFDRYVNGVWNDQTDIPADKTRIGAFMTLRDLSEERLKGLMDELVAGQFPAGSDEARLAAAYRAFMDDKAIDAAGLAPARPYLDRIFAARTTDDLVKLFATPGFASPIDLGVDADLKASDRYTLYLGLGGLGLPDRDYYLEPTEKNRELQAKYKDLLTFMLGRAGYREPGAAADAVYSLETRLAQEMWDRTILRDNDLTYNRLERGDLDALGPDGLLGKFVADVGAGDIGYAVVGEMPLTEEERKATGLTLTQAAAKMGGGVPAVLKLIGEVPVSTWQAYLAAHFLADHAAFLPSEIDEKAFAFYDTALRGQQSQKARWKRALDATEDQLGDLLGKLYGERFYPPEERAAMDDLVANLRKAMESDLSGLSWMGPDTRKAALAKLDAFVSKIGTPDKYKAYEGLAISPDAPLANALAASDWSTRWHIGKIGKPVDRTEWFMYPHTVNAYYHPIRNEIVFPAAILQPPFFNLSADPAVNYGAIGAVIGHEIGHGFDDQGSKTDERGQLRDWWSQQDKARFKELQAKLGAQYDAFCPFDQGKTCVDSQLTMGENIGDLGGLSLAYKAYRLSLDGKEAPVIGGFTGDQRFFMAWAQIWRGKTREEQAREYLKTDPHSPPKYRINGIVRNFDEWYRAFDVKPGDALYLPPEKRVRIW